VEAGKQRLEHVLAPEPADGAFAATAAFAGRIAAATTAAPLCAPEAGATLSTARGEGAVATRDGAAAAAARLGLPIVAAMGWVVEMAGREQERRAVGNRERDAEADGFGWEGASLGWPH
jgi:hypothetical protein